VIFGIVVEDQRDASVYSTFVQRIRPDVGLVLARPCRGVAGVRQKFVGWLKNFEWHSGHQVGKAIVIRDSDCGTPRNAEDELAQILEQSGFRPSFPTHFYATRCELETWLLADEGAVNRVAQSRKRTSTALAVADPLEGIRDAKERILRMLSQAGLPADPTVYAEIASRVDLGIVERRCPYFRQFVERLHAC
jgi:hypothetical protein